MNGTFSAIVYWNMMIIVHLMCMFLISPLSLLFSHISNQWSAIISVTFLLKQPNNYIKFHFQFWSTSSLEKSRLPLHLIRKHGTAKQLHGSANRGGINLNKVLNRRIQVNCVNQLLYYHIVSGCPSPGREVLCIFIDDLTMKRALLLFTLLSASTPHFEKRLIFYYSHYILINNTHRIIGDFTVNIMRVSDQYWSSYNFSEIEQWKVHFMLLYIEQWW